MPSLQQLRWETFADRVEKIRRSTALRNPYGGWSDPLDVRIETQEGDQVDLKLYAVDLDGGVLIGRGNVGGLSFPLARVKAVWHHKRRMGRALSIWFATLVAGTTGGALGAVPTGWGKAADGAIIGALLGAIAGIGVLLIFDRREALYQWIPLYEPEDHALGSVD